MSTVAEAAEPASTARHAQQPKTVFPRYVAADFASLHHAPTASRTEQRPMSTAADHAPPARTAKRVCSLVTVSPKSAARATHARRPLAATVPRTEQRPTWTVADRAALAAILAKRVQPIRTATAESVPRPRRVAWPKAARSFTQRNRRSQVEL